MDIGITMGLVIAFAGGAFGASIGALPSFVICGVLVLLGESLKLTAVVSGGAPPVNVTAELAFGPFFGPHVAFGGGAAAAAYVGKFMPEAVTFPYHPAKHIVQGLGNRWDVLTVGGLFGVSGHLIASGLQAGSVPVDPVAAGVVGSAFLHRIVFRYQIVGEISSNPFDLSAYFDWEAKQKDLDPFPNSLHVEPWLPYMCRMSDVLMIGSIVGLGSGMITYFTGSVFFPFGISVVVLVFMCGGVEKIPVTHHMSLPAATLPFSLEGMASGGILAGSPATSLVFFCVLGAVAGIIGAVIGEGCQRMFYTHAETHLDPPAASIVVTTLLISGMQFMGYLPGNAWIPG